MSRATSTVKDDTHGDLKDSRHIGTQKLEKQEVDALIESLLKKAPESETCCEQHGLTNLKLLLYSVKKTLSQKHPRKHERVELKKIVD